jgi:PTH1 family peptidyl-tRNA hydrolase
MFFNKQQSIDFIIAGLGNPGLKYETTRHNAGFMFIDRAAQKLGLRINQLKHFSLCEKTNFEGRKVLFLKPQTYMNDSGRAVADALGYYKLTPAQLIVVYDDISLPPGGMRIRKKGSAGGQKGMKSIIDTLGTDEFVRIKIGVGSPPHADFDVADYVLGDFPKKDLDLISPVLDDVYDAVELIVNGRIEDAMNRYNKRGIGAEQEKND